MTRENLVKSNPLNNAGSITGILPNRRRIFLGVVIFLAVMIAGLYYVKWSPYYAKALIAASKHTIGASIVSEGAAAAPSPSWGAALGYATMDQQVHWMMSKV